MGTLTNVVFISKLFGQGKGEGGFAAAYGSAYAWCAVSAFTCVLLEYDLPIVKARSVQSRPVSAPSYHQSAEHRHPRYIHLTIRQISLRVFPCLVSH